jgi:putative ribosome biogenesis GTPase RsgA
MSRKTDKFRFRKLDTIGSIAAECDEYYLKNCFVDTGEIAVLEDFNDSRHLVVGRTGFGKTALLNHVIERHKNLK